MLEEIIAPLLTSERGRYLGLFLMILFGVLSIGTLIKIPFDWHADHALSHPPESTPTILHLTDQTSALIKQIPYQHLLGRPDTEQSILPMTRLPFALIGIIQSTSNTISRAIISNAGQSGKIYHIGDRLSSDIKISAIHSEDIVVDNGGHLEKLPLQRPPIIFQPRFSSKNHSETDYNVEDTPNF
jgi:type II secretory pathway component PulC